MADTYITNSMILGMMMDVFENNLKMVPLVYRGYEDEYNGSPKKGSSFKIKNPWLFEVQDGPVIDVVDLTETTIDMTVTDHKVIPFTIMETDRMWNVDRFKEHYLEDAMIKLANEADMALCNLYADVSNFVGTAGSAPAAFSNFGDAAARLDLMSTPPARSLVCDPIGAWSMAGVLGGLNNDALVKKSIETGKITDIAGLGSLYSSQNIAKHTAGTGASYQSDHATAQTGSTIHIDTGTGTFLTGDIVTFAGCNAINPVNYQDAGHLRPFAVTADFAGDGDGDLSVSPAVVATGPTKNVTNAIANNQAVTLVASHTANLAFHQKAFAFVCVKNSELPETATVKEKITSNGLTMTLTAGFDIVNYKQTFRLDMVYGVKTIRGDWATRILG